MSLNACLIRLQAEGKLDAERAQRMRGEYERLNRAYGKRMGAAVAEQQASTDVLDALGHQLRTQRRQAMLQIQSQRKLLEGLTDHIATAPDLNWGQSRFSSTKAGNYAVSVMEHHEGAFGSIGVENQRGALFKLAWAKMDGFLGRYSRDMLGRVRNGTELRDVVHELRGEGTGNGNAREMAAAVRDTLEWLRQEFNLAGGDIPKLANWGLPQSHDALEVAKASFEGWRDFIRPLLNPAEMIDKSTGKAFASEDALDEALDAAWKNISSEGMDGQVPGAFTGQGKLANRRADHRFFVFKDADAWLSYNERFGSGDVFDAITGHIDSMTRDIAAMQVLGPNPAATVRWLGDLLRQDALPTVGGGKALPLEKGASVAADRLQSMWDYYSGALTMVPPEHRGTARIFSGLRNWNVATKLGSATVSAMSTDPMFMGMTAKFNGLPVTGELGNWLKTFNPADPAHRAAAESAGLIFSDMIQRTERMWREGQGMNVHELTRRGADAVMRGSLLTPHTVAGKQSIGLSFMKDWADHAEVPFARLDEPKRLALQRYGIEAADWDRLRAVPRADNGGISLLRPGDLARRGDRADIAAATKFFALIDSETRFGLPGESLRAQAAVATWAQGVTIKRGRVGGELLHSMTQFKTYSAIMVMTQLQRALYGRGGMSRLQYGLTLPVLLTLGGYLANSLHDISQGKDPAPLADDLTFYRAVARGGGLGIVGDLISAGAAGERATSGPVSGFIVGPTLSSVVDPAVSLTIGNIGEAAQAEDTRFAAELTRQLRGMVPGNNVWYARLAYNRLLADQLQELADPRYRQSWRRMHRRAAEQGSQFYWAPGDALPERAPDLTNITAEGSEVQ